MKIGYGSITTYDALRYDLYLDNNIVYFIDTMKNKYIINLDAQYLELVLNGGKIWVTLTQQKPSENLDINDIHISIL